MKYEKIQKVPWGRIEWIMLPENNNRNMSIGRVIVEPGKEQVKHMHIGDEQCLITISGEGQFSIDDHVDKTKKNDVNYFPPYAMHSTVNTGDEPLVQLLISCPIRAASDPTKHDMGNILENHINKLNIKPEQLKKYIVHYMNQFNSDDMVCTEFPIAFCTHKNEAIIPCKIPDVCRKKCKTDNNHPLCTEAVSLMKEKSESFVNVIKCSNEIMLLISQIKICGITAGYLQGGYFNDASNMIDTTLYGIIQLFNEIAAGLRNTCMEKIIQYNTQETQKQFVSEKGKSAVLSKALEESQDRLLHMEIKNHFLFNTLNSIAALSLTADRNQVYQSIVNLSTMFRNQLQKTGSLVSLKNEAEAQKIYMELMKLRFENKIKTKITVSERCKNASVPFNVLQPFIENGFIHGFRGTEKDDCCLMVNCIRSENSVIIHIKDNGEGMDEKTLERLKEDILNLGDNGVGMSCSMLKKIFDNAYNVDVDSTLKKGTEFTITIPYKQI